MTVQKKNSLTLWASICGSVLVIAGGLSFGYDSFVAPKVQKQIDTCMMSHQVKQDRDMQELKTYMEQLMKSQIESGKAIARIEGKIERIR